MIDWIDRMIGGEVFVPKIPSMRLIDTAMSLAPTARRQFIGIRPGEKLHEELITVEEAARTREFDTYYVIEPEHPFWNRPTRRAAVPWRRTSRTATALWGLQDGGTPGGRAVRDPAVELRGDVAQQIPTHGVMLSIRAENPTTRSGC